VRPAALRAPSPAARHLRQTETGRSLSAPFLVSAGPEVLAVSALATTARAASATTAAAATATALLAGLRTALATAAALLARSGTLATGSTTLRLILSHLFLRTSVKPAFS
jgi:hypothetical protein